MMNIQPGLLQKNYGRRLDETQMNEARADYIKKML